MVDHAATAIDAPLSLESRSWTRADSPAVSRPNSGLCLGRAAAWSPLTGDASDRRYFRVLFDGRRIDACWRCTPGRSTWTRCPSCRWRGCCAPFRCRCRRSCTLERAGHARPARTSATSRCRRTWAPPRRPSTRRSTARRWRSSPRCSSAARRWPSAEYPPYAVAFDVEKLTWELEFFVKHYLSPIAALRSTRRSRDALREEWAGIVEELAAEPRVLCHRDYHSRNLMLHGGSLYIIDFQDARMGPDTYDLASLLRDSYVDLPASQVDEPDRLLPVADARRAGGPGRRRCRVPAPVRSDGAAAQPEGAGHVRLPDHHARQPGLHAVHAPHAELREGQPRAPTAASAGCASCWPGWWPSSVDHGSPGLRTQG